MRVTVNLFIRIHSLNIKFLSNNAFRNAPIMDAIDADLSVAHPGFVERYFTRKFYVDASGVKGNDHCVLVHTNKLCVITLAPSHTIIKENKTIKQLNFQVSKNVNRLDSKATGKSKKGAQLLMPTSPLCVVTCTDDSVYPLCSCVKSQLLELNDAVVTRPQLLAEEPEDCGFLAIVMPGLQNYQQEVGKLLSEEQYQDFVRKRDT